MGRVWLFLLLALALALTALALLAVHQVARPPLAVRLYADVAVVVCWLSVAAYGVTRRWAGRDAQRAATRGDQEPDDREPAVRCTSDTHPQAKPRWSTRDHL
ncbi:hypothetical protein ABZ348_28845 [Streptomyces sp. NPDC005963]|uniref:hypothetical protein n=1 Tax=Streptomyces sp. NPDC005963 TaxID=3156721 RepID=UPI0033CF47C1